MHLSGSASWRRFAAVFLLALVAGDFLGHAARAASVNNAHTSATSPLDKIENVIVIYLENWSFDGLFGKFPGCNNIL
jgi:phospholipase C